MVGTRASRSMARHRQTSGTEPILGSPLRPVRGASLASPFAPAHALRRHLSTLPLTCAREVPPHVDLSPHFPWQSSLSASRSRLFRFSDCFPFRLQASTSAFRLPFVTACFVFAFYIYTCLSPRFLVSTVSPSLILLSAPPRFCFLGTVDFDLPFVLGKQFLLTGSTLRASIRSTPRPVRRQRPSQARTRFPRLPAAAFPPSTPPPPENERRALTTWA